MSQPDIIAGNRHPAFNRITIAWAFFDFANSAYALLITGVAYQIYFKKIVFANSGGRADLAWAITVSASILISALVSPLLGALADNYGFRKRLFVLLTWLSIIFTCSLFLVNANANVLGVFLFFLANLSYNLVLFLYDSYIKLVSAETNAANISGFGWGLGYVGGIVCLALTYPLFVREPSLNATMSFRYGFLAVGIFFLVFSIPALKFLPAAASTQTHSGRAQALKSSYRIIWRTLKEWRQYREIFKFLLAFYFVTEAIMTAIYFTANYLSTTFGLEAKKILFLTLIIQLIAFPVTWLAGYFADKWNLRHALFLSIIIWIVIVLVVAAGRTYVAIYVMAGLMGLVIGSTQALGRAFLSNLAPADKISEFFGFNSLSSKVAATIGPLLFGIVSFGSGSQRWAWLSLLPFLIVGGVLTLKIKQQRLPISADNKAAL